jgi:hypothetical protein
VRACQWQGKAPSRSAKCRLTDIWTRIGLTSRTAVPRFRRPPWSKQRFWRIGAASSAISFQVQRRMTPSAFALRATADKSANPPHALSQSGGLWCQCPLHDGLHPKPGRERPRSPPLFAFQQLGRLAGSRVCQLLQLVCCQAYDLLHVALAGPHFGEPKVFSNQSTVRVEGVIRCSAVAPAHRA